MAMTSQILAHNKGNYVKLLSAAPTRCNFVSRLVGTVKEKHDMIIMFFRHVLGHSAVWDIDTIIKAQSVLSFLQKYQTSFFS